MSDRQFLTEQQVLGALMWDAQETEGEKSDDEFRALSVEDFETPQHKIIFRTMIDRHGSGPLRVAEVTEWLRAADMLERAGDVMYVTGLLNTVFTSAQLDYDSRWLRIETARRQAFAALNALTDISTLPGNDLLARLQFVRDTLSTLLERIDGEQAPRHAVRR